jgi:hypothetical protein
MYGYLAAWRDDGILARLRDVRLDHAPLATMNASWPAMKPWSCRAMALVTRRLAQPAR